MRLLRLISFALCLVSGSALAAPILWIDDSLNRLGTVDVATGTGTIIGSMGNDTMTDIAFDPSGNLWGISFGSIYRINKTTAAATLVGAHGINGGNALVFGSNGTLYAAGATNALYSVNTATGAATSLGNIGAASAGDLAFNGGNLFLSSTGNSLVRIGLGPPATGTVVGALTQGDVFGLATGDDGILYAASGTGLFTVNTSTGTAAFLRNYTGLGQAFGTAFFAESGAPIPEPSSFVLLGLGGLGMFLLARRRRAH